MIEIEISVVGKHPRVTRAVGGECAVVLIDNTVERARWATDKGVITMVGDATSRRDRLRRRLANLDAGGTGDVE